MAKSFKRIIYINLCSIFFTLVFIVLFSLCITLFIPIYIFRFFVSQARKVFRKDLGKLVQTRSAVLAGTDDPSKDPNWVLIVWQVLDGRMDFEQFCKNINKNTILKKNSSGQLYYPEYQQYFSNWLGFTFWKWEDNFDLREHMRYLNPEDVNKVVTEEDMRQIIKRLSWEAFPPKKSPWEVLFVPNYKDNGSDRSEKSVVIFRVHHGFCDGFAIMNLMKEVNNNVENVKENLTNIAKPDRVKKNIFLKLFHATLFWITCPYLFMKMVVRTVDTNEWHLPSEKLSRPRNLAITHRIPIANIKEIKNLHGVSFSAVIFACLTGALREMMQTMGKKVPPYMSTGVAVPMPGHPLKLRNHFIFSFLQLPMSIEDPVERLKKVERNIMSLKSSPVPLFNFGLIPIIGGTFSSIMKVFSPNPYSTLLTSNFPGPPTTTYFTAGGGNNAVLDMNFAAGLGEGNVGIGFCILSYNEGMRIVSSFDKNILPSDEMVELFNQKVLEQMDILRCSLDSV